MWFFNIFNPWAWFSAFNPPAQPSAVVPVDEDDLPEDFKFLSEYNDEATEYDDETTE
jgi:hypothetical protein